MDLISPFVITISRQLGSGGAYLGQQLSRKLNIHYADREIITKAAEQLSVLEEKVDSRNEKVQSFWSSFLQFSAFAPDVYIPQKITEPTDYELFTIQSEIIKRIAREHSAVIIGRCGFHLFRDHPNHLSIFLHAGIVFRKSRIMNLYNVSEETAAKMIAESDKGRALYCKTFTGKEWTDARNYDISLDTGKTGIENAVELILYYLSHKTLNY